MLLVQTIIYLLQIVPYVIVLLIKIFYCLMLMEFNINPEQDLKTTLAYNNN